MQRIIDSHCHLDFDVFDTDRDEVLSNAASAGVEHIVIPGVDADHWQAIQTLCNEDQRLHACYGLHPYRADQHQPEQLDALRQILTTRDCVALGECGLDYRDNMPARETQDYYFQSQLEIAQELQLPVVIHSVRATEQVISALKQFDLPGGMIHSYSGSYEQGMQLHDMGYRLSFGGAITYERARRLRDAASRLPLQSLLVETDAPDQTGSAHHDQRNEPAWIIEVIDTLCELRTEDRETIMHQLFENSAQLFGLATD